MRRFTISEITKATRGELLQGRETDTILGFAIDSREAQPGQLFVAIKGERSDGHDFCKQVASGDCGGLLVSNREKLDLEDLGDTNVILVDDTIKALQRLAVYYLNQLPLKKKIGITGSVGKTSTRDMVYYVLSTTYKTGKNKKNYNSAIGLPLSILDFDEDTEVAVLEMGMDNPGEIQDLAELVKPDIAIITKIAEVNMAVMKSLDNILAAKMEITTFFHKDSTLIVNASCPQLRPERVAGDYSLVTVGSQNPDFNFDYNVAKICDFGDKGIKYTLDRDHKQYEIELPVPGAHNALNSALAIACGQLLGIDPETAALGLKNTELTGKRLKVYDQGGIKVIDDTYNACEDSVKSAIDTLVATQGKRKIAVLGDIIGLGERAQAGHKAVGRHAAQQKIDLLIAIGDDALYYAEGAKEEMEADKVIYLKTKEEFDQLKQELLKPGDVILVKASRGMALEYVVNKILEG